MTRSRYGVGFYARGFDGRIDDSNAGWKGRGLWNTIGDRTPWLIGADVPLSVRVENGDFLFRRDWRFDVWRRVVDFSAPGTCVMV